MELSTKVMIFAFHAVYTFPHFTLYFISSQKSVTYTLKKLDGKNKLVRPIHLYYCFIQIKNNPVKH